MSGGTAQFDTITDSAGTGAPNFSNGFKLSGSAVIVGNASPSLVGVVTSYAPIIRSAVNTLTSTNGTSTATDGFNIYDFSTGASNRTLTLPAVASSAGRVIRIVKTDSGAGNVSLINSDGSLLGATTTIYTQYAYVTIMCDGSNWYTIGGPFEQTTASLTFTQSGGYTQTITAKLTKIGSLVEIELPTFSTTATAAAVIATTVSLPAGFIPVIELRMPSIVINAGAVSSTLGAVYITTAGLITVNASITGGTFTNGQLAGLGSGGTSIGSWMYKTGNS